MAHTKEKRNGWSRFFTERETRHPMVGWLTLILLLVCRLPAHAEGRHEFCGFVSELRSDSTKPKKLKSIVLMNEAATGSPRQLTVDILPVIHFLSSSYFTVFDKYLPDQVSEVVEKKLRACFDDAETKFIGGEEVLISAKTLHTDGAIKQIPFQSIVAEGAFRCPAADATHRYLDLPLSYEDPSQGRFRLYFELNSGFDPKRPLFFKPTDPQRTSSIVGNPDLFIEKGFAPPDMNIVMIEPRGQPCSPIPVEASDGGIDWEKAYRWFKLENTLRDMDAVRRAMVGDAGKVYMEGESGHAITALLYMSRFPESVEKAILVSAGEPQSLGWRTALYFDDYLASRNLSQAFQTILDRGIVDRFSLMHMVQRLFYRATGHQDVARLIRNLAMGDRAFFHSLYDKGLGHAEFEADTLQYWQPNMSVYSFELFGRPNGRIFDINYRPISWGQKLLELARSGKIPFDPMPTGNLGKITAEILLVSPAEDSVTPRSGMVSLHQRMPGSRLAFFRGRHALADDAGCLFDLTRNVGKNFRELFDVLSSPKRCHDFVGME